MGEALRGRSQRDPEISGWYRPLLDDLDDNEDDYICIDCSPGRPEGWGAVYLGETHGDLALCQCCGGVLNDYDRELDDG